MNAFIVELRNKPGEVARVTEALAQKGINVTAFAGAACGDGGSVCLVTNDEAATRRALQDGRYTVHERELVTATLADRPGSLADACRRLGNAGVNIEAAVPTGMSGGNVHLAFATDNPGKARSVIGEEVISGTSAR